MLMIGQTISSLPVAFENIEYTKIENGIYDDVYATHVNDDVKTSYDFNVPDEWDEETYFHAKFNGNLISGNYDFTLKNITNIIVKRRKIGTHKWMPMFNIEINSFDDFNFLLTDYYCTAYKTYEYASVPVINGEEGSYSISNPCEVKFNNLVIIDKDEMYTTPFNITISQTNHNTSSTIIPIMSRYPIYVSNSMNDYFTGNVTASFIVPNCSELSKISQKEVVQFRENVLKFLNNRKPKYIKDPNGRCWIATIGSSISDEENGHPYLHNISFDFTEIGDIESNTDMYNFGFLTLEKEWWI